jgi:hypothetical protein
MAKKRGKFKSVKHSSKTSTKKFFSEDQKTWVIAAVVLTLVFSFVLIASNASLTGNAVMTGRSADVVSGDGGLYPEDDSGVAPSRGGVPSDNDGLYFPDGYDSEKEYLCYRQNFVSKIVCFTIGDPVRDAEANPTSQSNSLFANNVALGGTWGLWAIHISIWMIIFMGFFYVFKGFVFTNKKLWFVPLITSFGLAIVAANLGVISGIIGVMASVLSGLGAAAIFVAMGMGFVFFIIVVWFGGLFKVRAAKKMANAIKNGGTKMAATITALGEAGKAYRKLEEDLD